MSHSQYVANSPADLPMPSVKEQTLMWQGVGQPGYVGDSGIHSGATTQVSFHSTLKILLSKIPFLCS